MPSFQREAQTGIHLAPGRLTDTLLSNGKVKAPRNFRLSRTHSVLMPPIVGRGIVAGEACTELGCESTRGANSWHSWLERLLGISKRMSRSPERKEHGTQP